MSGRRQAVFAVLLVVACTPWPGDTTHHFRPPREPPAPPERAAPPAGLDDDELTSDLADLGDELPDLTGTWAQRQVTVTVSNAPMVGELRSTTSTLLLVEIDQQGPDYTAQARVCGLTVDTSGGMRTTIPDAFVAAVPVVEWRGRVERFEAGYRVVQAPTVQILGAELEDPRVDALPHDASDERVVDQDGDGHPGMTIQVEGIVGGDIYIVQRTVRTLEGVVRDRQTLNGHIDWTMQQVTLGASSFLLDVDTNVRAAPEADLNVFRARRLETGSDCAAVLGASEQLSR